MHALIALKSQDKDTLYNGVERTLNLILSNRMQITLENLNAKIGKENIFRSITGNQSLYNETNNNKFKLIDLASRNNLVIKTTMLPHKNIHKRTWRSPNGM